MRRRSVLLGSGGVFMRRDNMHSNRTERYAEYPVDLVYVSADPRYEGRSVISRVAEVCIDPGDIVRPVKVTVSRGAEQRHVARSFFEKLETACAVLSVAMETNCKISGEVSADLQRLASAWKPKQREPGRAASTAAAPSEAEVIVTDIERPAQAASVGTVQTFAVEHESVEQDRTIPNALRKIDPVSMPSVATSNAVPPKHAEPTCCLVAARGDVAQIDSDIRANVPLRAIAARYEGLNFSAVQRHRAHVIVEPMEPKADPVMAPPKQAVSTCGICDHRNASGINAALRMGTGLGTVAKRFGLVRGTLWRHRSKCLGIVFERSQPARPAKPPAPEQPKPTPVEASLALRKVDGWTLGYESDGDEPRIRDVDLGDRLGYAQPGYVKKLIRRLFSSHKLNESEVLDIVSRTSETGGRPSATYWLTEEQALIVVTASETPKAIALTREIIRVFIAARHGALHTQPAPSNDVVAVLASVVAQMNQRDAERQDREDARERERIAREDARESSQREFLRALLDGQRPQAREGADVKSFIPKDWEGASDIARIMRGRMRQHVSEDQTNRVIVKAGIRERGDSVARRCPVERAANGVVDRIHKWFYSPAVFDEIEAILRRGRSGDLF